VHDEEEAIGYELSGHAALFQGDYKLVRNQKPAGDGQWYLYNIVSDPGEVTDLKASDAQRYQRMLAAYKKFTVEAGVQPLPEGYSPRRQMLLNYLAQKGLSVTTIGLLILFALLAVYGLRLFVKRGSTP